MTESGEPEEYRQYRFARPVGACELLLIRHGESAPTRPGIDVPLLDGHADPPLDPVGNEQASRLAGRLADEQLAALYVTPLRRTHETAAPLAAKLGLEPVVEPDLREVFLGEWETTFRQRVAEEDPLAREMIAAGRWDVIPGAEAAADFCGRIVGAVQSIAARHADQAVAVFAHGGVIAQLAAHTTGGRPFAFLPDNGSITQLVVCGEQWILRRYNDTAHLGPLV